jgi:hypothetical protein
VAHETRKLRDLKRENVLRRLAMRILRVALLAYIGCAALLTMLQDQYIYYPAKASERELLDLAAGQRLEP